MQTLVLYDDHPKSGGEDQGYDSDEPPKLGFAPTTDQKEATIVTSKTGFSTR